MSKPTKFFNSDSIKYFEANGLDKYFNFLPHEIDKGAFGSIDPNNKIAFPPNIDDLVNLHKLVRSRKCMTVLEFGVGYSTLVIADALLKNKKDYAALVEENSIRCMNKFKIFSVDANPSWIKEAISRIPESLRETLEMTFSKVEIGTFKDQICHYYTSVPDVSPDFIYLDGPSGSDVEGEIAGSSFKGNIERTVLSADILRLEPSLVPGTVIVVDGRQNNVRFMKNNFQRNWKIAVDQSIDATIFELVETPLGIHNKRRLQFCLGEAACAAYEAAGF